jgi:proline racemase
MIEFSRIITTVDAHAAGEPLRIITSGLPLIPGKTILEKRRALLAHFDHLRKLLMLEPRGHSGMYGCLVVPPVTDDGHFGVIFMHNEGYSTMCGHGTIAVTRAAFEIGLVEGHEGENIVRIDAPAGRITSRAVIENGKVVDVSFENVPSFVFAKDVIVDVDGLGDVPVDIAFGGAFYVYADAERLGVKVLPGQIDRLVALGVELKRKIMDRMEVVHPLEPDLCGIYGTIICDPISRDADGVRAKNICIFADAQIDRSPTGTGTSGRLAQLHAKGQIKEGQLLSNRSLIDTLFWGKIIGSTAVGPFPAVKTLVGGAAHITGFHRFVLEPDDPLPHGLRITGG